MYVLCKAPLCLRRETEEAQPNSGGHRRRSAGISSLFPNDLGLQVIESLTLPIVYQTADEIEYYRQRFSAGLAALTADISLETPTSCRRALEAVACHRNFLLSYQGKNDLELQQAYGRLVHRIAAANFPEWTHEVRMPGLDGRLRIGYISTYFYTYSSVAKAFVGWLLRHDRSRFEVCAYHVGPETDALGEWAVAVRHEILSSTQRP